MTVFTVQMLIDELTDFNPNAIIVNISDIAYMISKKETKYVAFVNIKLKEDTMTKLVYGIYDIPKGEYIMTVNSKEVAHELCLQEKDYAFKPIVVATSVSEAQLLIRNDATGV